MTPVLKNKSALKFVFNHGLRSKYTKKHPWEFFREIAAANKNRKINTIRHRNRFSYGPENIGYIRPPSM